MDVRGLFAIRSTQVELYTNPDALWVRQNTIRQVIKPPRAVSLKLLTSSPALCTTVFSDVNRNTHNALNSQNTSRL